MPEEQAREGEDVVQHFQERDGVICRGPATSYPYIAQLPAV